MRIRVSVSWSKLLAFTGLGALLLGSLALLLHGSEWLPEMRPNMLGCASAASKGAFRADTHFLARLGSGPNLVQLTDNRETADEVLLNLGRYRALVVVTAGRSTLTRRSEDQPFISLAAEAATATTTSATATTATTTSTATAGASGPLSALSLPLQLMNAAAAGVERVLGRRLFPITLATFDRRGGAGPYAIFDASAGRLLLDRALVAATWGVSSSSSSDGGGRSSGGEDKEAQALQPQVSFLTQQLASGVWSRMAAALPSTLRAMRWSQHEAEAGEEGVDGEAGSEDGDAKAAVAAVRQSQHEGKEEEEEGEEEKPKQRQQQQQQEQLLEREGDQEGDEGEHYQGVTQRRRLLKSHTAAEEEKAGEGKVGGEVVMDLDLDLASGVTAPGSASGYGSAAAAAAAVVAAAVAAALPAAFAAAPPLWFCILCPSVLGLLAPVVINVTLNQVAGALCTQLALSDDQCFDVLLGALGAGFVLSLASAVPIFFVCRLPECANRNVTAALRTLARGGRAA